MIVLYGASRSKGPGAARHGPGLARVALGYFHASRRVVRGLFDLCL